MARAELLQFAEQLSHTDVRAECPFTETIWEITVLDTKTSPTKNCHHFSLDFPQKAVKNKLIFSVKVY